MKKTDGRKEIVQQLKTLISKGNAHVTLDEALKDIPKKMRGTIPESLPYSLWQLAEHIRIAQWDILEFSRNPKHVSPQWPDGFWPKETKPADDVTWRKCLRQIRTDRKTFLELLNEDDLLTPFAHGDGQHLLREALLLADHNSYHTGEVIAVRRMLGIWK